jgi:hypothetical protein
MLSHLREVVLVDCRIMYILDAMYIYSPLSHICRAFVSLLITRFYVTISFIYHALFARSFIDLT